MVSNLHKNHTETKLQQKTQKAAFKNV